MNRGNITMERILRYLLRFNLTQNFQVLRRKCNVLKNVFLKKSYEMLCESCYIQNYKHCKYFFPEEICK